MLVCVSGNICIYTPVQCIFYYQILMLFDSLKSYFLYRYFIVMIVKEPSVCLFQSKIMHFLTPFLFRALEQRELKN